MRWIGWACLVAVAGCSPAPAPVSRATASDTATGVTREVRSLGFSIGTPGALADFRPTLAAFGDRGRCRTLATEGGGRVVLLEFENGPGGAERTVSLEYDAAGTPLVYADARGDLSRDGGGPLTSITIRLSQGDAQASNGFGGAVPFYQGQAAAALEMENLGSPRVMMERIRRECGTRAQ